jgi:hypothetical protein
MNYTQDILNLMQELELQRVAELKKFGSIALVVLVVALLFFIKFRSNFLPILMLGFIVLIGSFYMLNSKYKQAVEGSLLPKLVKAIDPDFDYIGDKQISLEDINDLKYFSHKIENIHSNGIINIDKNSKNATLSFVKLESISIDTEEGEHQTERFNGAIVVVNLNFNIDQNYLLSEKGKTVKFEAGEYLNAKNMGLKPVSAINDSLVLYSQNGNSTLDKDLIKKVMDFRDDLMTDSWTVFTKDHIYIFIEGLKGGFNISLLKSLKDQYFIANYSELLKRVKKLVAI